MYYIKKDMDEILLNHPHITLKILNEVGKDYKIQKICTKFSNQ